MRTMLASVYFLLALPLNVFSRNVPLTQNGNYSLSHAISWKPCPDVARFQCATFDVPLDYAHPEVGHASLAVARLKATKQPRLGTIFTNPGGPGAGGVGFLMGGAGDNINNITLGQYDVVSWDPRGVNNSKPLISCGFTTIDSAKEFYAGTIPVAGTGIEARGNFTDPDDLAAFFGQVNATDAIFVKTGQKCVESDGAFMKYMGTAAVVRDMVSLSDVIDGVGSPIHYWGISYGTVLGSYFVNMFPERVGRVVIDGVVDIVKWATEPSLNLIGNYFTDTESVMVGFASECAAAGPQGCSLAQANSTTESIFQGVRDLIDTAYDLHKQGLTETSSYEIRNTLFLSLLHPTTWKPNVLPYLEGLAATFANITSTMNSTTANGTTALRSRNGGNFQRSVANSSNPIVDPAVQQLIAELVISCVDSIDQEDITTEQVFKEIVRVTHEVSPTFGETVGVGQVLCHRFPVRAVERFTGPFNHTPAHPIIVIGNKGDPKTPMINAQKMAGLFGNSARFMEQIGFGHSSLAEHSVCTHGVLREFFLDGKLPVNGTVCQTNDVLFPADNTSMVALSY